MAETEADVLRRRQRRTAVICGPALEMAAEARRRAGPWKNGGRRCGGGAGPAWAARVEAGGVLRRPHRIPGVAVADAVVVANAAVVVDDVAAAVQSIPAAVG